MAEYHCRAKVWDVLGWLLVVIVIPGVGCAESVKLPMTFDFALLRSLIVEQAYHEPVERAEVVVMNEDCNEIWLAKPRLQEENGSVKFQTDISIIWGAPIAGKCIAPLQWSGTIVLWQKPIVDSLWQLRFLTHKSMLLEESGKEAALSGLVWNLVKKHVHAYIDAIAINLAPPVDNLKKIFVAQPADLSLSPAERFLASMRPDVPQVRSDSLVINILAEADIPETRQEDYDVPAVESPEIAAQVMELWRTWDALLVNLMSQVTAKPLTVEDRQLLLDILLTVRYEFSAVLGSPGLTTSFVRSQFINSWIALKPLFENHLTPKAGDSLLGYLSFFTAADALVTLDRLSPLLGIDVSREGFYRMAHMLSDVQLNEGGAVDVQLREVLGFGTPLAVPSVEQISAPSDATEMYRQQEEENIQQPPRGKEELLDDAGALNWLFLLQMLGPAKAYAATNPTRDDVMSWTAGMTPAETLLPRVREVLVKAAASQQRQLPEMLTAEGWQHNMIEATAWQESCFRQFVVKDQKITYLLSYNNSSVGIMQVNEKVWRGIYDLQELRWNIEYNGMAGMEILTLYLNRYLARQKDLTHFNDASGRRYLATWLYSLYNGGPGQLKKFPKRSQSGKLYKSELLFQEKYDLVERQSWLSEVKCLPAS